MRHLARWTSLLLSSLLFTTSSAKKDKPSVEHSKFDFLPSNVQYFDDSDTLLFEDQAGGLVYRSENAGEKWSPIKGVPELKLRELVMHKFDNKRAYIITFERTHWMTSDRGKTWEEFYTDSQASIFRPALEFHAGDSDRIIFNGMECTGIFCEEVTMYTLDGFSKSTRFLRADTNGCHWAKSTAAFTTGQEDLDANRILCVVNGQFSPFPKDFRLLISDNFFTAVDADIQEFEPELEPQRTVKGIVNMATVTRYLVAAVSAEGTDEMALYISDDSIKWHRAIFPHDHKIIEHAYTVLESTNYSIQIDVMNSRPSNPMGVFLSSNSNGTYFTRNLEYTNRDFSGFVDFEKVSGIQGIVIANTVINGEEVLKKPVAKKIRSQISFDDGRDFQDLKCEGKSLHLHSVTELSNVGRVFSSPAPGLLMGIGNTGDMLKSPSDGNLYVSDDAGVTWIKSLDGPHKYEFGDQGSILVAVEDMLGLPEDKKAVKELKYSLNHGKKWETVSLKEEIRPLELTTTKDSTSLKFLLVGLEAKQRKAATYIFAIDFDEMHERKCNKDDMETWNARVDEKGNPICIMGHTQSYERRKKDADCFIKNEFEDPVPVTEACDCTDADFECDFNFVRSEDRKECNQAGPIIIPDGACKAFGPDDTFQGTSGWRQIPGNDCKRKSGKEYLDAPKERKCSETATTPPASGDINSTQAVLRGSRFQSIKYLEQTSVSNGLQHGQTDETVLVHTNDGVFLSHDHGKHWNQPKVLEDEDIVAIYDHKYINDVVFFITSGKKVFYSIDRGDNIRSFDAPYPPADGVDILNFHPKNKDWFIWIGQKDCDSSEGCHTIASLTKDRGDEWTTLQRYVGRCEFIKAPEGHIQDDNIDHEKLIVCETRQREVNDPTDNPYQLVSSDNFFAQKPTVHLNDLVDFATMSEFIVAATRDEEAKALKASVSVYGNSFAEVSFPHGFAEDHGQSFTVLDCSTHAVFLFVTASEQIDAEYGSIIKSNSNGTFYAMSLRYVNRDRSGYLDFEKMLGIEGVAVANVVANYDDKELSRNGKKLKTLITHNDGAEWDLVAPPAKDVDGKKYSCGSSLDKCALHLHGYTERLVKSHTFYSNSAVGLMLATGNVGEFLAEKKEADTFITADGGATWKFAKKGRYMWEFGDQGSIVVLVKDSEPTKVVHYTLDEGETWLDYEFSSSEFVVSEITTVPSDNARNFLLWGTKDKKLTTINIDFTGLTDKQCKLDETNPEGDDYYLWQPKHPKQDDDCLFGHVSQYHRKRTNSKCYNGPEIAHLHDIAKNCTCTRRDFECDFNFEPQTDGSCALVKGFQPPDHSLKCTQDSSRTHWYEPTGYRRIPITTCEGGRELDVSTPHACAGHEEDFNKKFGPSAAGIFFAITIPIAVAAGVGYWAWKNWGTKFGQIRLGEQSSFDSEAPYVRYPVMAIAGLVALVQAIPLLVGSLWRTANGLLGRNRAARFTTRDSFARGRSDYTAVDNDEGELLGDDSDEDV